MSGSLLTMESRPWCLTGNGSITGIGSARLGPRSNPTIELVANNGGHQSVALVHENNGTTQKSMQDRAR
jgi:hypothetical protein